MDWEYQLDHLFEEVNKQEIILFLSKHPEEIPKLIKTINHSPEKRAWRTAWIIDLLYRDEPALVTPYLADLRTILKATPFNGVRRSLLKIINSQKAISIEDGELLDKCFQWIISPAVPTAVRAHAMQYAINLLPSYPELKNELQLCLQTALHDEKKGIKAKARNLLKQISRMPHA
ncbi:hypothetical protein [Thermophagus sp. OGC60D27]|uniref:hypothetical protein n=1 Tax=Thermophagus sp. OGC60D27 TaxID=3458415 RepID=UPI00403771F9